MKIGLLRILALVLLIGALADAHAVRRTLRIDFGDWEETDCSQSGVSFTEPTNQSWPPTVRWNGNTFRALDCAVTLDAYCQETIVLDQGTVPKDEPGLAQLIGSNSGGAITGARQSLLNVDRFDAQALGYGGHQWAFYFFPNDITIVALYGLIGPYGDLRGGGGFDFDQVNVCVSGRGCSTEYQGEYFCFRDGEFTGTWNGDPVGPDPAAACPDPDVLFLDGFEG